LRPLLEVLEDRTAPAIFTVNTTADETTPGDGLLSLREAINAANASPFSTIKFAIAGGGLHVISPTSALPTCTVPTTIDATTQAGIVLDGTHAGNGISGLTLGAGSSGSVVKGLTIDDFSQNGILVNSSNNTIQRDKIGIDARGVTRAANTTGVSLDGSLGAVAGNVIQFSIISGNNGDGVLIVGAGATGNKVLNNYLGTDATGARPLANLAGVAILDEAAGNLVQGDVVSGNNGAGVALNLGGSGNVSGNVVKSNYIGLNATGTAAIPNITAGVAMAGATNNLVVANIISGNGVGVLLSGSSPTTANVVQSNRIGTDATGGRSVPNLNSGVEISQGANNNSVDANQISGNHGDGVLVDGAGTNGNNVLDNTIGLSATGASLPNGGDGVEISTGAAANLVAGNFIMRNASAGVAVHDPGTSANLLRHNQISLNAGSGVQVLNGAAGNTIGGTDTSQGNTISFNAGYGVVVTGSGTNQDAIEENAIFGNEPFGNPLRGIVLGSGASGNNGQPSPTLVYAVHNRLGDTLVSGTLHGFTANATFRLEFFDNQGGGRQGQRFLGFANVSTDNNGDANFAADFAVAATLLTSTATDPNGNTSEFSNAVVVSHL
jgi:CSLREA domain-containing protein